MKKLETPLSKSEIITWLLPYLKSKNEFFKLSNNPYFNYVKEETLFQFFVVRILRQSGYNVIVLGKEGKKSIYERFMHLVLGNLAGRSDIFVTSCKTAKGCFFELKKCISEVYTKKLKSMPTIYLN